MWSLCALILGFFLDLIVGDPHWMPHPIVFIGKLIDVTEKAMRKIFLALPWRPSCAPRFWRRNLCGQRA